MVFRRILFASLSGALLISGGALAAQQQESVADAARRARAEKKQSSKPAVVVTNDTLSTIKGSISVVGPVVTPPEDQPKPVDDKAKVAPADAKPVSTNDEAAWRKRFAEAHKKLASDTHELDILQREYNLKQQQYYSDPNTAMREQYNRQDLTDTKKNIDDMSATVAQDKQAVSDLEDALQKAGGDMGWSR